MQLVNGSWRDGLGSAGTTLGVFAVATQGSDVYVGGSFHIAGSVMVHNIARWDGSTCHDVGGGMVGYVFALAFDKAGNLYAGGSFTQAGGVAARGIAKWDGSAWSSLGSGITTGANINAIAIDTSGNVYVGGDFSVMSGVAAANVAMWNGSAWSALGTGCTHQVTCLAFDESLGALYAGGWFLNAGGPILLPPGGVFAKYVARWSGGAWSALGTSVDGPVQALAVGSGGILYAGGYFTHAGGMAANYLARWNAGTGQWSGLATANMNNAVKALLLIEDQYLHVGGDFNFSTYGGIVQITYYGVVDTQHNAWGSMGYFDFSVLGLAGDSAGNIYAVGIFEQVQSVVAHNVAKWNGSAWSALGAANSVDDTVLSLVSDGAGNTYVGGLFRWAGVQPSNNVAKWNGSTWTAIPLAVPGFFGAGSARAMTLDPSGALFVSGDRGGALYAIVYRWSGTSWAYFGQAIDGEVFVLATAADGTLYVGGSFVKTAPIGGTATTLNYLALWNGTSYFPVGGGTDNCVAALRFEKAGNLYAGGYFITAGGLPVNHIAKWDGSKWNALGTGTNGAVLAVTIGPVGEVYAGGGFTTAGAVAASSIAKWDGSAWSALGSGVSGSVNAIVVDDLGIVVIGGTFTLAGSVAVNHVAKWDGTTWSALDAGVNDDVYALSLDSGGNLAAGGDFSTAGGKASCYFAYYTAIAASGSPNPPGAGPPPPPPGTDPTPKPRFILWWVFRLVAWLTQMLRRLIRTRPPKMGD